MFSSVHAIGFCLLSLPLKLRKESESKQFQAGDFPGSPVDKNLPCNAGDTGSIPGQGAKILRAAASGACAAQLESPSAAVEDPMRSSQDPRQPVSIFLK